MVHGELCALFQAALPHIKASLAEVGALQNQPINRSTAPVQEIKGRKNLNTSWKTLIDVLCRRLPDTARSALVTGGCCMGVLVQYSCCLGTNRRWQAGVRVGV